MTATLPLANTPPPADARAVRAVWLADIRPADVTGSRPGGFVFVPNSRPDEIDGRVLVEAAGPPGVLRTVQLAKGEDDTGLDVAQPVVEGVLMVIRHPARGQFRAVGFLVCSAWRSW